MSDDPDADIARRLRLRTQPPVARLSRRAAVLAAGGGAALLAGLLAVSLHGRPAKPAAPPSAQEAAPATPPETVTALPRDYAALPPGVPRLGPPLPGDLGRPILAAQERASSQQPAEPGRRAAGEGGTANSATGGAALFAGRAGAREASEGPGEGAAARQTQAGVRAAEGRRVPAGTILTAALVTGVRSEAAGLVIAQVLEDVPDEHGAVAVPGGARLLGRYEQRVAFGQDRVRLTFDRLLLPDGRSVALRDEAASDPQGRAGLSDRVDRHWGQLFAAAAVAAGLGASRSGLSVQGDGLAAALRYGLGDAASQAAGQVVGRSIDIQPTLSVRPGMPFRLLLAHDLTIPIVETRP